jgi:hypothetical protein
MSTLRRGSQFTTMIALQKGGDIRFESPDTNTLNLQRCQGIVRCLPATLNQA